MAKEKITMTPVELYHWQQILLELLWDKFIKELLNAKLCASDKLYYITGEYGSQETVDEYWFKWLKDKGYTKD